METRFEAAFLKAVKTHASIRKLVKKKVDMIIEDPIAIGEPLKGKWQGFYSSGENLALRARSEFIGFAV